MKKTVNINVEGDMLDQLKDSGYKLCIAKKVENYDYNVAWYSTEKYLEINSFSWVPQYEVFATNSFLSNTKVGASCTPVRMDFGEITTFSRTGRMSPPVTGGAGDALNIKNEFGLIRFGINQLCTGVDGSRQSSAIFVTPSGILSGEISFKPSEKIQVWFEQSMESSTILTVMRSNCMELDMANSDSRSVLFNKSGSWVITA